ncbi:vWA domain-containing protein [Fibrobacter sp.]|uniref:vWA domain-containing protein n=1 Tax=Fibrobacter sp. TaxID=35828 RepID=UPI00388EA830
MKSKIFFSIGFALSLLCAACSDSSTSADIADIADNSDEETTEDTLIHKNQNIETENGATFETKGSGFSNEFGFSEDGVIVVRDSYKGDFMVSASYDATEAPSVMEPEMLVDEYVPIDYAPGGDFGEYNGKTYGLLTASEWNDLDNWSAWADILTGEFSDKTTYWKFHPTTLAVVKVVDENGTGLANVSVELLNGKDVEFATKTDNKGLAYCWVRLFDDATKETVNAKDFSLKVNGKVSEDPVKLSILSDELKINTITSDAKQADAKADIAFIVDATGSMGDEIRFLQSDLKYIIDHAHSETNVALRTAVEFYRDEDDEYVIQGKDFSTDVANTQTFIDEQVASGGGDYPEAVHTALESSLQNFSWNESARARIAFLILDAPAHHQDDVIESLQKSITLYAKHGIKLIPVAASGVDKDTESMLRFFEIITGGTYVFLTDDSGIGYSHIEASVGDHEVEKLADLMIRLIKKYVE